MKRRILILRFSSIGDVLQTLSVAESLRQAWPDSEIHWLVREDLRSLPELSRALDQVHGLKKAAGFRGLLRQAWALRGIEWTHVYDAHNNLRSHIVCWVLRVGRRFQFLRRPIRRFWRFLLFRWRINLFKQPFSGQRDLLEPLKLWGLSGEAPPPPVMSIPTDVLADVQKKLGAVQDFIALAPSAAYPLKRWPLEYWEQVVNGQPQTQFVVLGGAQDQFLAPLAQYSNVQFLVGQLNLIESAAVVALSRQLVANDTGVMHMAEQLGVPCVALMGPAPFGFPSRPLTKILQRDLPCRPCSKHGQGPCTNSSYQQCLRDISPQQVARELLL